MSGSYDSPSPGKAAGSSGSAGSAGSAGSKGAHSSGAYGDGNRGPAPRVDGGAVRSGAYGDGLRGSTTTTDSSAGSSGNQRRGSSWNSWQPATGFSPGAGSASQSPGQASLPSRQAISAPGRFQGAGTQRAPAGGGSTGGAVPGAGSSNAQAPAASYVAGGSGGGTPSSQSKTSGATNPGTPGKPSTRAGQAGTASAGKPTVPSPRPGDAPPTSLSQSAAKAPSAGATRPTPAAVQRPTRSAGEARIPPEIPPNGPAAMPDEDIAALERMAKAFDKTGDISDAIGFLNDALETDPANATREVFTIRNLMSDPTARAQLDGLIADKQQQPSKAVFQGYEDDPRSAHGRIVDPVQLPDELPEGWRQSAGNESDGPPKPAKPRMPIKPDEAVHDWYLKNHEWFESEDVTREHSKAALDAMIDRMRIQEGWGKLKTDNDPPGQSKGENAGSANGLAGQTETADAGEGGEPTTDSKIGPFKVPSDPEDMKKFMRWQLANPDATLNKKDRVIGDELKRIITNGGMSKIQNFFYFIGPDGHAYYRGGDPSYTDPEATRINAREMMMIHAAKFDVPWDDALINGVDADSALNSRPISPGSELREALRKIKGF